MNTSVLRALVVFVVVPPLLFSQSNAPGPAEQLQQLTAQLQQSPGDQALREKIIKLAQELKPAPTVPDEAIGFEGRGQFAFKNARTTKDYLDAAKEYEQAVKIAPWVSGYYSDLCTINEKAGIYLEAKKDCGLFLIGTHDQAESADTKRRIAGLDFAIEKYSAKSLASSLAAPFDANRLPVFPPGTRYFCNANITRNEHVREEFWVVVSGSTIHVVELAYADPLLMVDVAVRHTMSRAESWEKDSDINQLDNPIARIFRTKQKGDRLYTIMPGREMGSVLESIGPYYTVADDESTVERFYPLMGGLDPLHYHCIRE